MDKAQSLTSTWLDDYLNFLISGLVSGISPVHAQIEARLKADILHPDIKLMAALSS